MPEFGSLMVLLRGSTSISVGVFLNRTCSRSSMGWALSNVGSYVCRGWRTVNLQFFCRNEVRSMLRVMTIIHGCVIEVLSLSFPGAFLIDCRVGQEQVTREHYPRKLWSGVNCTVASHKEVEISGYCGTR